MRNLTLILFISLFNVFGQSDKKIDKCIKTFKNKGYDKGIQKLNVLMSKQLIKYGNIPRLRSYEVLVAMEYERFSFYSNIQKLINVEISDTLETTSVENIDLITQYEERFFNVCRRATIESRSHNADLYYRKLAMDLDPDTSVSEKAKDYYTEAEEFFGKEDYELAELNYRKALNEEPKYYKALLYLGDSFWAREDYDSAMVYYYQVKEAHPQLLEPRKYIIDALVEKELYFRAKKECLEAFVIFPSFDLKLKYQKILSVENKFMNDHRFTRLFYLNNMAKDDQMELLSTSLWTDYRAAKGEVSRYCNDAGIIEENGVTSEKYLEVFSIRKMLEGNKDELPEYLYFAAQMEEEGFLEPYIFIGLFHVDIYPQFMAYMEDEENRKKALEWIEKYCIESTSK